MLAILAAILALGTVAETDMAKADLDDIIFWPDNEWCYRYELSEYAHKSDDYEVVPFGSTRWADIVKEDKE